MVYTGTLNAMSNRMTYSTMGIWRKIDVKTNDFGYNGSLVGKRIPTSQNDFGQPLTPPPRLQPPQKGIILSLLLDAYDGAARDVIGGPGGLPEAAGLRVYERHQCVREGALWGQRIWRR